MNIKTTDIIGLSVIGLIVITAILGIAYFYGLATKKEQTTTIAHGILSQREFQIDPDTGCEYIIVPGTGIFPRIGNDGAHVCADNTLTSPTGSARKSRYTYRERRLGE